MAKPWSPAARSVWGKTSDYEAQEWLPLVRHLQDSASVAGFVWDWLPPRARLTVEECLPPDACAGRTLLRWLAGVHDIGKASPPFAAQSPPMLGRMHEQGLVLPVGLTPSDSRQAKHGLVGQHLLTEWLRARGVTLPVARSFAVVVGGHHGVPPTRTELQRLSDRRYLLGGDAWAAVQREILDGVAERTGADQHLAAWVTAPLSVTAQAILTGAVIVSDWLASNTDLFPYRSAEVTHRAELAWDKVGLPPPWHPTPPPPPRELMASRFPRLSGREVRPVQEVAVEAARAAPSAPLLIVEAGMGSGKTEAALMAAEVLAARFGCGGVFVGLPTMATSDAMFTRVLDWIEHLEGAGTTSTFLAHSKAGLNDAYRRLFATGRLSSIHDDQHGQAAALAWLQGRKKGVLASMVVGTVDQLLFAALQAKHAALRHLAFAGKVVVVDEVHAADDFMRRFLVRALEWLAAYGVPVILLSATLPSSQRQELVDAYRRGLGLTSEPVATGLDDYPLVTTVTREHTRCATVEDSAEPRTVAVETVDDDLATLTRLLEEATRDGGCVAVIRNTVTRAQEAARHLRERFGGDVVCLHHSRFIATHRATREASLRDELGPDSTDRPELRIVVGTQVLEQSLDIDVDLMVTDLAPVDLILQRVGRLHRHPRGGGESERPAPLRRARVVVTGIDGWDEAGVPVPVRGSRSVYGDSRLIRSAAALQLGPGSASVLTLPDDIRRLVESAYAVLPEVPAGWLEQAAAADARYRAALEEARGRADQFRLPSIRELQGSLVGWLADSSTEAEDGRSQGSARVRDGEDGIEVIVVQRIDGETRFIADDSRHAGTLLPTELPDIGGDLARALAATTIRLPAALTRAPRDFDATLAELEGQGHPAWQDSPWLRGQLVLHLDEDWCAPLGGFQLRYDHEDGLVAVRQEAR